MNIRHWLIRSLIALSLVLNLPAASLGGATAAKAQDASILAAGDENWDNRFGLPGGEGGEVNLVAVTDNGDIYIAGRFTQSGQVGNLNASLSFPPGAVSEPIRLNMTPATDMPDVGGLSVLGQGFHIERTRLAARRSRSSRSRSRSLSTTTTPMWWVWTRTRCKSTSGMRCKRRGSPSDHSRCGSQHSDGADEPPDAVRRAPTAGCGRAKAVPAGHRQISV